MNRAVDRKPLRADAARNVNKIIAAARQCFREHGPEVPLQTIAVTAGVGPATLFRNFADKEELVLAALHQQLKLLVNPVIEEALAGKDAAEGLFRVVDALMGVTLSTWLLYAGFLALRPTGRRAAHLALFGFALVVLVRIALAWSHF